VSNSDTRHLSDLSSIPTQYLDRTSLSVDAFCKPNIDGQAAGKGRHKREHFIKVWRCSPIRYRGAQACKRSRFIAIKVQKNQTTAPATTTFIPPEDIVLYELKIG